jgi:hypothetical protein
MMLQVVAKQALQPAAALVQRQQQQQPAVDAATLAAACGTWVKVRRFLD